MTIPQIQTYVEWLSFACLVPLIGGLLLRTGQGTRLFIIYLIYEAIKQLFLLLNLKYFHMNTLFVTHISSVLVPVVFMFVLIPRDFYHQHKVLFWAFISLIFIYYSMDLAFDVSFFRYNINTAILACGIIVLAAIVRLYHLGIYCQYKLTTQPIFWIASFTLVYYATNFYFYAQRQTFLEAENWQRLAEIQFYNMIAYTAIYMLPIGYGFFKIKYTQK